MKSPRRIRLRAVLLIFVLAMFVRSPASAAPDTAPRGRLTPVDITQFFIMPGAPSTIEWSANGVPVDEPLFYTLTDYSGTPVSTGQAVAPAGGRIEITVKLPKGYYEVAFRQTGQSFGIVSLAPYAGKPDPFFCLDSALSWLERRRPIRESLVSVLQRIGVPMVRERFYWGAVMPSPDTFAAQTDDDYEGMRAMYEKHGIAVMDILGSPAPQWAGLRTATPFPDNLPTTGVAAGRLADRWSNYLGALEVWNEPNQGATVPADQYAPLVDAVSYSLESKASRVKVGVGVFGEFNRRYVAQAIDNGILAGADFMSFHDYSEPTFMQVETAAYRSLLKNGGDESLPLWISECGYPWTSGPPRPSISEGQTCASEIVMKAVEARACGIARFFPFVYPSYLESGHNYGLMGVEVTPIAPMAAYAQAIQALSGLSYTGDFRCADPRIQRARVFGDGAKSVVVLYTGKASAEVDVDLHVRCNRIEGIDGRSILAPSEGVVPVPDGIAYVWADERAIRPFLIRDTLAGRLLAVAELPRPAHRAAPAPLILQYMIDRSAVTPYPTGYYVAPLAVNDVPLTIEATNLSGRPARVTLTVIGALAPSKTIVVPAQGSASSAWSVDLTQSFAKAESTTLRVTGSERDGRIAKPVAVTFTVQREFADYLKRYPASRRIDLTTLNRWSPNISENGKMSMAISRDAHWVLSADFNPGPSWVFPLYSLRPENAFAGATGLLIRAKQVGAGTSFILFDKSNGSIYQLMNLIPADGRWHARLVRFDDCSPAYGHPADTDGILEGAKIEKIQLGTADGTGTMQFEVSDLYAVTLPD